MMEVGWVGAMFSKMPPESSISNLSDNEYKRLIEQIHSHRKSSRVFEIKNSHLVSMKQISEPEGDFASEIVSPNCQTDREVLGTK